MVNKIIFKSQISETANLFHFISNMTEWHFSVRSGYKEAWLAETGDLTTVEKTFLKKFEVVLQRYGFGENFWGKVFLREKEKYAWQLASKKFKQADLQIFQQAKKLFYPRFKKVWKKEKINLKKWQKNLERTYNNWDTKGLIDDLNIFFDGQVGQPVVTLILLISPSNRNSFGGGANLEPGVITLEISGYPLDNIRPVWLTIWHELVHSLWQGGNYWLKVKHFAKLAEGKGLSSIISHIPLDSVINEAVTESLFAKGYLAEKYFQFPSQDYFQQNKNNIEKPMEKSMIFWRIFSAYHLINLSKKYIEYKKPVDNLYFQKVLRLLSRFDQLKKIN